MARWPSTAKLFLKPDGSLIARGTLLVQSDLAATLEAIAKQGPRAFYEGPVADKIVRRGARRRRADDQRRSEELQGGRAPGAARHAIAAIDIVSMPPPSSGGVVLIEMLNILEGFKLKADDPESTHLMVEAMRYAYADRAHLLGDPDFVKVPIAGLMSKRYAATLARQDRPRSAPRRRTRSRPADPAAFEGDNTTHYSVVDRFGNAVANTYTLNLSYGVGLIAEGTGVLLNNELDDFAAAPGAPNAFGLVGYEANEPGPNKRPLSSMTPTIVLQQRQAVDRHRLARRQPHHHRGAAGAAQRHRLPHDDRGGGAGAAHPSSMAAGRDDGRGRRAAGDGQGAAGARPQGEGVAAVHLGAIRSW